MTNNEAKHQSEPQAAQPGPQRGPASVPQIEAQAKSARQRIADLPGEQSLMGVATADQPTRTSDEAELELRRVLAAHSESIVREACRIFGNVRPDVEPDAEPEIALPPLPSSRCQGHVVQSSVRPPFDIEINEADMETAREIERLKNELTAANAEIERLNAAVDGLNELFESQKCPECGRHRPHCDCLTAEREAREKSEREVAKLRDELAKRPEVVRGPAKLPEGRWRAFREWWSEVKVGTDILPDGFPLSSGYIAIRLPDVAEQGKGRVIYDQ